MAISEEIKHKQAERLKEVLKDNHATQKQLAEMIHISEQSITKWATGKAAIPADRAKEILKLFPYSPADIPKDLNREISEDEKMQVVGYRLSWLLGQSDYKNRLQERITEDSKKMENAEMLKFGLSYILNSMGYSITDNHTEIEPFHDWDLVYTISKENKKVSIPNYAYNDLKSEITDFIQFKLNRLFSQRGQ